ncbi:MAG: uroporphyrinogen decarboxylase family protein [Actinobacteria bacterium]|nr:uroporphyrinogen decarboxylase family protein [Actinomycetota bacterium]
MTPKERVLNRLEGKPVDKIPNLNIIMTFAAKYINIPYKKYVTDYRYLVEGNVKCCEKFGIDMVSAISDPYRETYDLGANIIFPEDDVPICTDFLLKKYSDIKKLHIKNPLTSKRMLDRIKAIELYKKEVGNNYPILGWIEGPISEAANLRGVNNIMTDFIDAPDFVNELFELCSAQAIEFGIEQIRAGADFIGVGDAAASLIGPYYYKSFVLPFEIKIFNTLHQAGGKVKLHICGNITPILHLISQSGADIVDVDWMVDFEKAVNTLSDTCAACGNFNPVILLNGSTETVEEAVKKCIKASKNNTMIAAGCEVPKETPYENMLKVDEVLRGALI